MSEEQQGSVERFLTLTLADDLFALDIYSVREILDITDVTRIPQTPDFMLGVVNVRGNAIPVIDLRFKFGLRISEYTQDTRIVILEVKRGDSVAAVGALADSVKEVLELESSKIDSAPKMGTRIRSDFIRGIGKHNNNFVLILDKNKVFASEEMDALRDLELAENVE